jgi:hypothetical protein
MRSGSRYTTADYLRLSISRLRQDGMLRPGYVGPVCWAPHGTLTLVAAIEVEYDCIALRYSYQNRQDPMPRQYEYGISLDRTPCNLGGMRAWFVCPGRRGDRECGRRVADLYGGPVFACRHCYGLTYESQREDGSDRLARRADRIRKRMGWKAGIFNPNGSKPRGMHWATYARLMNRYEALTMQACSGMLQSIRRRHG